MVKASKLRQLAKLHRGGIEGAGRQLLQLAERDPDAFAGAIGASGDWVRQARGSADPLRRLIHAIDRGAADERDHRKRRARRKAEHLAEQLQHYCRREGQSVLVEPKPLAALASAAGYKALAFGPTGEPELVDRLVLRRVLSECRSTDLAPVELAPGCIRFVYRTERSRGRIQLRLHSVVGRQDDVLVVPLPHEGAQAPRAAPPAPQARRYPQARAEPAPEPQPRDQGLTPLRAVLSRVLEALSAEVGP